MDPTAVCGVIDEVSRSIASVRDCIKDLREKQNGTDLDTKDGISLLILKNHVMASYLQSLLLVSSRRALGHSLVDRQPSSQPFSDPERSARGSNAGDLVDSMIENRVVLEKIKVLETRMRYQLDKLVKLAEQSPDAAESAADDPLAFRPNPQNLVQVDGGGTGDDRRKDRDHSEDEDVYRPPRLAPTPYIETAKDKRAKRLPAPSALTSLLDIDPSRPHMETTSGLGTTPSLTSARARELNRITEYEEENFTRLMMKKKDHIRRLRDEEDIALGGSASVGGSSGKTRRRGGGFEDEFNDVLKNVGKSRGVFDRDGYEELRERGKKGDILERSRSKPKSRSSGRDEVGEETGDAGRKRKRSRFEADMKSTKKKLVRSRK
ncbi:hypothetical protein BDN71DRAFT_1469688 [Pleurotus eryngii]|uniref:Neuroguidin n=1 Tax=Pleurotus eryngii TaxID=5323 RepID=A0A9P5ZXN0_PLEER|nr:hypothetical protein BDN71DRAFT_1469688 [Pleurotus eryngii]